MAEIHIQRKPRNLWWLWLLIILIVAAVIYYLYANDYFHEDNLNVMNHLQNGWLAKSELPHLS